MNRTLFYYTISVSRCLVRCRQNLLSSGHELPSMKTGKQSPNVAVSGACFPEAQELFILV